MTRTAERNLILALTFLQFCMILDFMIVMPLGPDLVRGIGIDPAHIGWVGGIFQIFSAISGLASAFYINKFSHKGQLQMATALTMLLTFLCAAATSFQQLLIIRALAGAFSGPVFAITLTLLSDHIPEERRGRAIGFVMSSFSISSVLGVPIGLEIARHMGWRAAFILVGVLCFVGLFFVMRVVPSQTKYHAGMRAQDIVKIFTTPAYQVGALISAAAHFSIFLIVPNLATYLQFNLGFPRDLLSHLYLAGGTMSLILARWGGVLVDRRGGSLFIVVWTTIVIAIGLIAMFLWTPSQIFIFLIFMMLMGHNSMRMVASSSLSTKLPTAAQRGPFLAVSSFATSISAAIGSFLSAAMLDSTVDGRIIGIEPVAILSIILAIIVPGLVYYVERHIKLHRKGITPAYED